MYPVLQLRQFCLKSTHVSSQRSTAAVKIALWRQKRKVNPIPSIPKDFTALMDMEIPEKFKTTNDGGSFLAAQCWTNEEENRAIMFFMSEAGCNIMKTHGSYMFDGTFKSCPDPFAQVYILMASSETGGQGLPCEFALLPDNCQKEYLITYFVCKQC